MRRFAKYCFIVALAAFPARAADEVAPNDVFARPAEQLQVSRLDSLSGSKRVVVPTAYLRMLSGGYVWLAGTSGIDATRVRARYEVVGLDKTLAQSIAKRLYNDLVARLRRAGLEVLTYDDIKGIENFAGSERFAVDAQAGLLIDKDRVGTVYLIATPRDDMNFSTPQLMSPAVAFGAAARHLKATAIVPAYSLQAPEIWADVERGYQRDSVAVKALPAMSATPRGLRMDFINPAGDTGFMRNSARVTNLWEAVGTLAELPNETPTDPMIKTLHALGGIIGGPIRVYQFKIDADAYTAAAIKAGTAFNDMIAKTAAKQLLAR